MFTIDHIENIAIDPNKPYFRNNHALFYLKDGLLLLADKVKQMEAEESQGILGKAILSLPLNSGNSTYLACFFHWFGVSIVSYAKLVALSEIMQKENWEISELKNNRKAIKKHGNEYCEKIIPEIFHWRNKIAAHLAAVDPCNDDNTAMLEMSLMNPISWEDPHFYVGSFQYGNEDGASSLKRWSIVEEFEKLIPRYWPHVSIEKGNQPTYNSV
jgi:hypothetical protein